MQTCFFTSNRNNVFSEVFAVEVIDSWISITFRLTMNGARRLSIAYRLSILINWCKFINFLQKESDRMLQFIIQILDFFSDF
ncbi:MAG: hypothetical protein KKA07_13835 [Bacteroidetes bacterium]|nr:hypothetical protein [Bacteroidota bacterium]MBU1720142.1 hypothetical protein [Bacteroidota bacterium]